MLELTYFREKVTWCTNGGGISKVDTPVERPEATLYINICTLAWSQINFSLAHNRSYEVIYTMYLSY